MISLGLQYQVRERSKHRERGENAGYSRDWCSPPKSRQGDTEMFDSLRHHLQTVLNHALR